MSRGAAGAEGGGVCGGGQPLPTGGGVWRGGIFLHFHVEMAHFVGFLAVNFKFYSMNKTVQDSIAIAKKTARCAQYMGALKSFQSPHYAPGYFSRNL